MHAAFLSVLLLLTSFAHASEQTTFLDQALLQEKPVTDGKRLPPEDIYRRTQIVLDSFAIPPEPDYQPELDRFDFTTNASEYPELLKYLDPSKQVSRFFDLRDRELTSYRDRDSMKIGEYRFGGEPPKEQKVLSLQGLRVALDPGHMGGDVWDKRTGKYARTSKGATVSEGLINLQTALLVEQKLKALGAEVLVTHRGLGPVSKLPYDKLDLREYGKRELRARSLEDWFQNLLSTTGESGLPAKFKNSSAVQSIFSERARSDYYAMREDLIARAQMISAFRPDFTVVIHFDADELAPTPKMPNITRAYVPGSYSNTEFATGEARARFLAHLGQGRQWRQSVQLSKFIVDQISADLNVRKNTSDVTGSTLVVPGVFARNLALTRQIDEAPIAYLECLCYGNDAEFSRLLKTDGGTFLIDGKQVPYSSRLENLSQAITKGIVNFVKSTN